MKFSYEWLQSFFDKPLPKPDKLAELLTLHSFETVNNGGVLEIDVLPNRVPDAAAHLGIAREISAILDYKILEPNFKLSAKKGLKTESCVAVEIQEQKSCLRYVAMAIKGVKIKESPDWIKERLAAVGQKAINNVVDAMNYIMLETGQPLHAFDLDKISGVKITNHKSQITNKLQIQKPKLIVRKAKDGESIETLDNQKINLKKDILVIADGEGDALAIAGIKGGKKAEIDDETGDIIIEAAVFAGPSIRRTSRAINLKTDASYRFEHGISWFLPETAIKRAGAFVLEIAGGEAAESVIDIFAEKQELRKVIFNEDDVLRILGRKIETEKIEKILSGLGFTFEKEDNNYFVTPLPERTDINIKEDIAEEIARIYGYENISAELPLGTKITPEINEEYVYSNWVRGVLAGMGFSEVYNYSFRDVGKIALENPISRDKAYLRMNLMDGLKENIEKNFSATGGDTIRLFEIGKTFYLKDKEMVHIAIAVGDKKNKTDIVAELRGAAEALLIDDAGSYIKDNVFEISLRQIIDAAKNNNVDVAEVAELEAKDVEYKAFSRYPAITRDISLFTPSDTRIEEVTDVIENTGGELLIDSDLFDEYLPDPKSAEGGSGLGQAHKKSLAFRLIFQSFEKTLTDKEVNKIMEKIINALDENTQWQVRK